MENLNHVHCLFKHFFTHGLWRFFNKPLLSISMNISQYNILIFAAMAVVLVVLIISIVNLGINSDKSKNRSNQLMRLRVIAQFVAVILLMIGFWFKSRG